MKRCAGGLDDLWAIELHSKAAGGGGHYCKNKRVCRHMSSGRTSKQAQPLAPPRLPSSSAHVTAAGGAPDSAPGRRDRWSRGRPPHSTVGPELATAAPDVNSLPTDKKSLSHTDTKLRPSVCLARPLLSTPTLPAIPPSHPSQPSLPALRICPQRLPSATLPSLPPPAGRDH